MKSRSTSKVSQRAASRPLTILAQDPAVQLDGKPLFTQVRVPAERLAPGPWGYRVHVIDYDASTQTFYKPRPHSEMPADDYVDPFHNEARQDPAALLANPQFHQWNVYAIAMRILARFEFALGRRVSWQFQTHQLKIAPHAFAEANAFYSRYDEALLFGYFPGRKGTVFSCLSHDVVAHETTHALIDGLRERFIDPSSPDQAAFHEGFSDVVALLSVFALRDVVDASLQLQGKQSVITRNGRRLINGRMLTAERMRESILLGLAEQMGQELDAVRGRALRQSANLAPRHDYLADSEYEEPHRRGEIFVAAMMNAFLKVVEERIKGLTSEDFERMHPDDSIWLDRERVLEEAATAADHLLTIAIRALDYTMPVHLRFGDYLCAMLTADREIIGDDSRYGYRRHLLDSFASYGIRPATFTGIWERASAKSRFEYDRSHFRSLQTDVDEVFRFLWENRRRLKITDDVYTRVLSVRPCLRIGPDGFLLHETVAEYVQIIDLAASELKRFRIKVPQGVASTTRITLTGGGTLIFDEFGCLKYHVHNRVDDGELQSQRIDYLWRQGFYREQKSATERDTSFSSLHRKRSLNIPRVIDEAWH